MPPRPSNRTIARFSVGIALLAQAGALASLLNGAGCAQKTPSNTTTTDNADASGELTPTTLADAGTVRREEIAQAARAAYAAGTYDGPRIGAMNMVTSVLSGPAWPETDAGVRGDIKPSIRFGYLRHGAKVPVLALPPIVNESCTDGWYELVQGGFVCGRAATLDLKNPRVRLAPNGPDLSSGLPYRYGYNLTNGTPLYRRVLSLDDRKKYEPWLVAAPPPPPSADESSGEGASSGGSSGASEEGESLPVPAPPARKSTGPSAAASATPWFMRQTDGGKPKVALDELRGRGVLVRRMVRGFYLALDKDFKAANAHWWRTTGGLAVPFDRIMLQQPLTEYHGTWFGSGPAPGSDADAGAETDAGATVDRGAPAAPAPAAGDAGAPFARGTVVIVRFDGARKYTVDPEKKKVTWGEALPRRRAAGLTGASFVYGGVAMRETTEGFWIRTPDVTEVRPSPRPAEVGPNEKWLDVNLTQQLLIALEGDMPVFATYISSGRHNAYDKEHDYATPSGTFRIREKHVTATMDGDVAGVGPYSIEDVPWVMYYQGSYALHGAFWHGQFGHQHSHGCINMAPADARTVFNWVEPKLPEGWHGVFSSGDREGTLLVVHE
ncbi:L,D-transpeptidase [Pendulispora albinea]|uniref:L,D-transpeptidase n=1 Tax=Pendulispora albinea TaxID=2741071 RepID=A0ABZ2MC94_9BACT